MSRVAKSSIIIPNNVTVNLSDCKITVNGPLGSLTRIMHICVKILKKDDCLFFSHDHVSELYGWMQAGTCRSLVYTMVLGVTEGFKKQLNLFGVGYRVILENKNVLKLYLGFSHPVIYKIPPMVTVIIVSQTEIVLTSIDKQLVGQVAANIRLYRTPEPYKGKGIRYFNEIVRIKEAKKK